MKQGIAQQCKEYLTPIIEKLGYELVDVDWKKEYGEDNLTVYIDKPENFVSPFDEDDDISENNIVEFDDSGEVTGSEKSANVAANVITLKDCEYVHKIVDQKLDELDPTKGKAYILNISSCGADWAFRSDRDFQKNLGNMVDVSLFEKVNGKKAYEAKLESFSDDSIVINDGKNQIQIQRKNIAKICKHIEF